MVSIIERNYDKLMRFMMIGDSHVGKTAICKRLLKGDAFENDLQETIGVDIHIQMLRVRGMKIKTQIFDIGGQERYEKLATNYYSKADGVIIVYDVTRKITFKNVQNWLQSVKLRCRENVSVMLVGNKTDLTGERKVSTSSGRKRSEEGRANFIETSAMTGENILSCFEKLSQTVLDKMGFGGRISTPVTAPKLKYSKELVKESKS